MQRNFATGFEDSYRRHLVPEQRKAVLETIARELSSATTLGDIVDAAQELGWGDAIGEMNLGELAQALLGERPGAAAPPPTAAAEEEEEEEAAAAPLPEPEEEEEEELAAEEEEAEEEEEEEEEEEPVAKPARKAPPLRGKKAAAAKKAAKNAARKEARGRAAQTTLPIVPAVPEKRGSKKAAKKAPAPLAFDESMNLEQASKLLVPLVRRLKEATMQDLERETGMGRRKLRFHIGQLVKHGRLKRHGMGRGTCYTVK